MDVTFGSVADTAPEGFLPRRVHFNSLVELDTPTKEGFLTRQIARAGFGTRELPLTITGNAPGRGHEGAFPGGRLDMVRLTGNRAHGWGWLLDDANGRQMFYELATGVVRGNSIEMVDVRLKLNIDWTEEDELEIFALFTEANIGATTIVMKPAFGDSKAEIEELTAALAIEGDLEVFTSFDIRESATTELTASASVLLDHAAFTIPEPDGYQPFQVIDGRYVSGHLGRYGQPHTGLLGRRLIPHSQTNYAHFCKRRFPTDKGVVHTGPVILLGGHEKTAEVINKAVADPANAWADVVVHDGKIGPWVCGVVRPGVTAAALHAAMGSGISGHWLNGELYAVCSVSAEGFDVPRATEFVVESFDEDGAEVLVASFAAPADLGESHGEDEPVSYDDAVAAARAALEVSDADQGSAGQGNGEEDSRKVPVFNAIPARERFVSY